MIIRPVSTDDVDDIKRMADNSGIGLTTLPSDLNLLKQKIDIATRSFDQKNEKPYQDNYLFVLEDTENNKVSGTTGLVAKVGMEEAFYNYKVGTIVHASRELKVYNQIKTLSLSNDYTGCSELCTLFLDKDYRKDNNGKLLSKCRFLFMANNPDKFDKKIIAELRGYSDKDGKSMFWEGLGRKFFSMDFSEADFLTGLGKKAFIAELMPKHPLYINLLDEDTQKAIGEVHKSSGPAMNMLEKEGFSFQGYVDIFDAGPAVEAMLKDVRAIRESKLYTVKIGEIKKGLSTYVVSNTKLKDFRCTLMDSVEPDAGFITMDKRSAELLLVKEGDHLRAVAMNP
jgi:arginine N-succinyltransferase